MAPVASYCNRSDYISSHRRTRRAVVDDALFWQKAPAAENLSSQAASWIHGSSSSMVARAPSIFVELIATLLENPQEFLQLEDNWDGEGAAGYNIGTWERATDFLRLLARTVEANEDRDPELPRILPADKGSIDLFWRGPSRDLLINFSANRDEPATFFGHSSNGDSVQGTIAHGALRPDLIAWLREV